jgi:hypothetical protein
MGFISIQAAAAAADVDMRSDLATVTKGTTVFQHLCHKQSRIAMYLQTALNRRVDGSPAQHKDFGAAEAHALVQDISASALVWLASGRLFQGPPDLIPYLLSLRIRLNLRYNPRHRLRPQGLKEKKGPGRDATCATSSIGIASMNCNQPRLAAARSIAIPYSWNAVMRCIV